MNTRTIAIGDCFRVGEVWRSPRGTVYRVMQVGPGPSTLRGGGSRRIAVLRRGKDGDGRKLQRYWDEVSGWFRPPELNEGGA